MVCCLFVSLFHCRRLTRGFEGLLFFLKSRGDERDGISACPFRRSCYRADLATGRINEERRRHPQRASDALQILKNLGAGIGVVAELINADIPEPLARLAGIAGI